jgi:gluconokinase
MSGPEPPPNVTIVVMGVSGSGKSSVLQALAVLLPGAATAEGDDFHPAANVAKMRSGHPLDDADRWPWLDAIARWIGEQEAASLDAIVTCSALRRSYRKRLRNGHRSVWFAHLVAPRQVLAERMATRHGHFMPAALLDSQLETLEDLGPDEPGAAFDVTEQTPAETAAAIIARLHEEGRRRRR